MDFVNVIRVTKEELLSEPRAKWQDIMYQSKVLVLKGLVSLTPAEHWEIHSIFGNPWTSQEYQDSFEVSREVGPSKWITTYSNMNTKGRIGDKSLPWHHDIPWHRAKRYPIRSLYPTKLTNGASEVTTNFCDADVIWKRIPKSEWEKLAQVDVRLQYWYEAAKGNRDVVTKVIPLVERHPYTKRYSVLLNSFGFDRQDLKHATTSTGAWIIDCWSRSEHLGIDYLDKLHEIACTQDNIYEHRWEYGDLVLFDNYSGVMHGRDRITTENTEREFWRVNVKHSWQTGQE